MVQILVEGDSDAAAVRVVLARRRLDGARVVPVGGATNIDRALRARPDACVLGICDQAEAFVVGRALHRNGRWPSGEAPATIPNGTRPVPADPNALERMLAAVGFFVCHADLEDELIRALGVPAAEQVLADHGALMAFRTFQGQPAHRDKDDRTRLRRFLGAGSGRKIAFAAAFTAALPDGGLPEPLARVVDAVERTAV